MVVFILEGDGWMDHTNALLTVLMGLFSILTAIVLSIGDQLERWQFFTLLTLMTGLMIAGSIALVWRLASRHITRHSDEGPHRQSIGVNTDGDC